MPVKDDVFGYDPFVNCLLLTLLCCSSLYLKRTFAAEHVTVIPGFKNTLNLKMFLESKLSSLPE